MKVVGIKRFSYVSKKSGMKVNAATLFLSFEDKNIEGVGVISEFVKSELCENVALGDEVELFFNKYNSVKEVRVVKHV